MSRAQMEAAFIERYGDNEVVEVGLQPVPRCRAHQILIEVHASCINPRDWLLRDGRYVFRHLVLGFPKILGSDVSGVIVELGREARAQRPELELGDEVVAMQTTLGQMGGYAQYMAVAARAVAARPRTCSHEHAAGLGVAGLTALQALRDDLRVRGAQRVAIVGASGGVGHYAVQIARHLGAHVIGICSAANEALVRALGADETIDYRSREVVEVLARDRVDALFDVVGRGSLAHYRGCLRVGGRYCSTVPTAVNARDQLRTTATHLFGVPPGLVSRTVLCRPRARDLEILAAMVDAGALRTVIDSVYPLAEIRAALARSRTKRAVGKIIVRVRE